MLRLSEYEEPFWERLQGMQLDEQEIELRQRKAQMIENAIYGTPRQKEEIQASINKLNAEIHRVSQLLNRARFTDAIRSVFGQDGLDLVLIEMERMRGYPYAH